ncbi:hypothetical protein SPACI_017130 [Sporomusa acidovorans DSM 3132]|uniref:DUF2892 domain-containing protein n=2 Tax=Sporomusa TaxID=2375 RepID=A0ABZ3J024_SPOA4|nr:hypothetical protein [Sporomusa acidovorans]OZC21335.1 hypothetical protein SPACI_19620 [Sporomusa acidovorans DSM 3132]SDE57101.1 hypothetical protein SAMN04488499_101677 [Sporomusa acidovorans]
MLGYVAIVLAFLTTGAAAIFYLLACLKHSNQRKERSMSGNEKKGRLFCCLAFGMISLASVYLFLAIVSVMLMFSLAGYCPYYPGHWLGSNKTKTEHIGQ